MNRTARTIIIVIFIGVIMFCAINIVHNLGETVRLDVTDRKLYTLSDSTKAILGKLRQPIRMKLYYTKTAVRKAPDQFRIYNNYYFFVEGLLKEYAKASNGMVTLEIIDPRPHSEEESEALRNGIRKFPMLQDESFFFGLAVQSQYGAIKTIAFFSRDRQNFLEYDITYLIDTVTARQKKRIGVLSSASVMGDGVSGYLAQMMAMQGRKPRSAWSIIEQLRQQYEVDKIEPTTDEIKDVDILLVIHPKNLSEPTLFAIDQFVLKGGRAIVLVDPFSVADQPNTAALQRNDSDLNKLLRKWGVEMPERTFAGDRSLALDASFRQDVKPEKIVGFMNLTRECVNPESVISANLNQVRVLFAGALNPTPQDPADQAHRIQLTPLIQTTGRGNTFKHEIIEMIVQTVPGALMKKFTDGTKPVVMGYLLRGRFKSNFPKGIDVPVDEKKPDNGGPTAATQSTGKKSATRHITGLKEASADCAVAVFSDVDFISDIIAYQKTFHGISAFGDNSALLMNTIEDLTGSSDLIAMRSRGSFQRPFLVVDKIEQEAAKRTAQEEEKINAEITGFQEELRKIGDSTGGGDNNLLEKSILEKKKSLEINMQEAQRKLRNVKMEQRRSIEELGDTLRNLNMWSAPIVILVVAIVLGIRRSVLRRRYVSHASDAADVTIDDSCSGDKQRWPVIWKKELAILGIIAVGMVVWTTVQVDVSNRPAAGGIAARAALLQGLDPAGIGRIVLRFRGGSGSTTLARQGGGFVVVEKDNYPAMMKKINELIASCLDIQTVELITNDKANFAELGLSDDKTIKSVMFLKPDKSMIAGILIGNPRADKQGWNVRLASSDEAYLSTNLMGLPMEAMDYISTTLMEIKRLDIAEVRADGADGGYVIARQPDGNAQLADVPAGKRARMDKVEEVFTALTKLTFADVKKDPGTMKFDRRYGCLLQDSTAYEIHLATKGGKTFARCTAYFMDKREAVMRPGSDSDAELKAMEAKLLARDNVAEFVRKTQGWIYEIPEPTAGNLTAKFADLLEDEQEKSAEANNSKK